MPSVDKYLAVSTPVAKSVRAVPREAKELLRHGLAASLKDIADLFRAWDSDGSGEISFTEFRLSLTQLGLFARLANFGHSQAVAEAAADALFGEYDGDGSGLVSCEEFLRYALRDALRQSLTRVIDLFRQFDTDKSGKIERAEFGKVLHASGVVAPEDVVERLFAQMDLDGSGSIEPKELHRVLRAEDVKLDKVMYPGHRGVIELEPKNRHGLRHTRDGARRTTARPSSLVAARCDIDRGLPASATHSPPLDRPIGDYYFTGTRPNRSLVFYDTASGVATVSGVATASQLELRPEGILEGTADSTAGSTCRPIRALSKERPRSAPRPERLRAGSPRPDTRLERLRRCSPRRVRFEDTQTQRRRWAHEEGLTAGQARAATQEVLSTMSVEQMDEIRRAEALASRRASASDRWETETATRISASGYWANGFG